MPFYCLKLEFPLCIKHLLSWFFNERRICND